VNKTASINAETRKSVSNGPSEKAERAYLELEAGADFVASAVVHDAVGEWLLSLAPGYASRADLRRLCPEA
jgi:hypothetical protein